MAKLYAPFFIALSLAAFAQDEEGPRNCAEDFGTSLLAAQPAFKENGARLIMGQMAKDGVRLPLMCPSLQVKEFYLLTKAGPTKLAGSVSRKAGSLPWACGGDLSAATLKPETRVRGVEGLAFVVHADKAPQFLSWRPAKSVNAAAKGCAEMPRAYKRLSVKSFAIDGSKGATSFEVWQRKDEKCEADFQVHRVLQASGQCRVLYTTNFDCDLMPEKGRLKLKGVYGILEATAGGKVSTWMLFDAPGYEGEGVSAVPYTESEGLRVGDAESIVYSGC